MESMDLGSDEVMISGVKLEWDDVMVEEMEAEKRFVELVKRFYTDVIFCVSFVFILFLILLYAALYKQQTNKEFISIH